MKKTIALIAVAATAALGAAAPAQAAGVQTIIECTDNPTGSPDRLREIRQCVTYDVNQTISELQACDDNLFGSPESIRDFRDCVTSTLLG